MNSHLPWINYCEKWKAYSWNACKRLYFQYNIVAQSDDDVNKCILHDSEVTSIYRIYSIIEKNMKTIEAVCYRGVFGFWIYWIVE